MKIKWGRDMVSHVVNHFGDMVTWSFPDGVDVEPDTLYFVDYDYRTSSDVADCSCSYFVKYMEVVPDDIKGVYLCLERLKYGK